MTIGGRFLPKSVNLRLTALFDHLREASRFDFQEFHWGSPGPARTLRLRSGQAGRTLPIKKSARELRQGGSDYRCCIPALAGFVSPQFDKKIAALCAPAAESAFKKAELLSAEWEIRLYARYVGGIHKRCFAKPTFALCTFRGQQMTSRRVRSQHLAARRDFKTLRYRFTCFASRN